MVIDFRTRLSVGQHAFTGSIKGHQQLLRQIDLCQSRLQVKIAERESQYAEVTSGSSSSSSSTAAPGSVVATARFYSALHVCCHVRLGANAAEELVERDPDQCWLSSQIQLF